MDKYVIVSGATGAIGYEISRRMVSEGENVILACRNTKRAEGVRGALLAERREAKIIIAALDLAEESSVRRCVEDIKALCKESGAEIKGVVNNAGVMNRRYGEDSQGRELTMAVNYHNTRLFTELLLSAFPGMEHIVFTTSLTRYMHPRNVATAVTEGEYSQLGTYGRSKRAITDFAAELSADPGVSATVACADPGVVNTGMITMQRWYDRLADYLFRPFIRSPRNGAIPAMRAYHAAKGDLIYCRRRTHKL